MDIIQLVAEIGKSTVTSINSSTTISDYVQAAIISAFATSIVSIIGFFVTNKSIKKSFKNELEKQKSAVHIEKMSIIPYEVLALMDSMIEGNKKQSNSKRIDDKQLEKFKSMMNTIYSYGTEEAIKIISLMQKENYESNGESINLNMYRMMSFYVLLATQIKSDVTGIKVNPEFWFRMRITDYSQKKEEFKVANNKLVRELELCEKFEIE